LQYMEASHPLEDRQTSISNINTHLKAISDRAKRSLKGIHIIIYGHANIGGERGLFVLFTGQ